MSQVSSRHCEKGDLTIEPALGDKEASEQSRRALPRSVRSSGERMSSSRAAVFPAAAAKWQGELSSCQGRNEREGRV